MMVEGSEYPIKLPRELRALWDELRQDPNLAREFRCISQGTATITDSTFGSYITCPGEPEAIDLGQGESYASAQDPMWLGATLLAFVMSGMDDDDLVGDAVAAIKASPARKFLSRKDVFSQWGVRI